MRANPYNKVEVINTDYLAQPAKITSTILLFKCSHIKREYKR